jgi:hypothetical protein
MVTFAMISMMRETVDAVATVATLLEKNGVIFITQAEPLGDLIISTWKRIEGRKG